MDHKGWCAKGWGPGGVGSQRGGGPKSGGPKISRFFPFPPQFSFVPPSLVGPFVEFWWCLKRGGPEMCTFGVLGLSREAPAAPKAAGVSHNEG